MGFKGYKPIDPSSSNWYENPLFAVYCIFGWLLISVSGSMFHFTYQWTHCNWVMGLFVAVNESVFEHMKILSFPVFLFWFISFVIYASCIEKKTYPCMMKHIVSTNAAIYSGVFCMLFFHLVVSVGFGFEPLAFDIFLFCMSAFVAQCAGFYCKVREAEDEDIRMAIRVLSTIFLILACFFHLYCTDDPPRFIPVLFQDIKGGFYGRPSNCTLLDGFTPIRVVYNSSNSTSNSAS
jgi:hypothetical protein